VSAAAARRLAVGLTLAAHDRDRARLRQLVDDVPGELVPLLLEAMAALADEGLVVATRDRDAAREALVGAALDLAADPD
jgi:hypothetical protein